MCLPFPAPPPSPPTQLTWFRGEAEYLWVDAPPATDDAGGGTGGGGGGGGGAAAAVASALAAAVAGVPHAGSGPGVGLLTRAEKDEVGGSSGSRRGGRGGSPTWIVRNVSPVTPPPPFT